MCVYDFKKQVPRTGRGANSTNRGEIKRSGAINIPRISDGDAKSRRRMGLVREKGAT